MQAASLQYDYGKQVAAGRESEARVRLSSQDAYAATEYIKEVFRNNFMSKMRHFSRSGSLSRSGDAASRCRTSSRRNLKRVACALTTGRPQVGITQPR